MKLATGGAVKEPVAKVPFKQRQEASPTPDLDFGNILCQSEAEMFAGE
jgi:hypothetical protein